MGKLIKVWNMFKVSNKDNRTTPMASFWCLYCQLWTYFTPCSSVSIVNFEHVNIEWVSCLNPASCWAGLRDPTSLRGSPVTLMWDCPTPATLCAKDCPQVTQSWSLDNQGTVGKNCLTRNCFIFLFDALFLLH